MGKKDLPLGVQDFRVMRTGNFVYVDKTRLIDTLLRRSQAFYFFSRPRRFGKSLLISTLRYLFEGEKELFEGLWISENTDYIWEKHPVIVIDFNSISSQSQQHLERDILGTFKSISEKHEVPYHSDSIASCFKQLIISLYKKYNMPVAILVIEDK